MKKIIMAVIGMAMFASLLGCDQIELPWAKEPAVPLTQAQLKVKIALQQEVAGLSQRLNDVQRRIDRAKEQLASIRFEHGDKFISDEIAVGYNVPLGNRDARIAVVEFTDYQCRYCARHAAEVMPLLKQHYIDSGRLGYYVRDFPLESHPQAIYAAVTALCAGEQGRYWAMHDLLFKNQKRLDSRLYLNLSRELGLDPGPMSDCLTGSAALKKVNDAVLYGLSVDVSSTPIFFVGLMAEGKIGNVIRIKGAMPYAHFSMIIDLLFDFDTAIGAMKLARLEKTSIDAEIVALQARLKVVDEQ